MSLLTLDFARRYLFGKKSTNSINIITGISIFGISIGTAALILILSVFNGFEGLLSGLFNVFNPDIKIEPKEGKYFKVPDENLKQIDAIEGVLASAVTIEEIALFEYKDIQGHGTIKGVSDTYLDVIGLDSLIINGTYRLKRGNVNYAVMGSGLRNKLAVNVDDKLSPIKVYMLSQKKSMLGSKDFTSIPVYPAGAFSVRSDNDYQYVLTNYEAVSKLLERKNSASAIELKLASNADVKFVKEEIQTILGEAFVVKDRYQQDETFLKVMRIEKWVSFLIAGLTMLLVAFNLLGALWMISLEKRKDMSVMRALGFHSTDIKRLYLTLGLLITLVGMVLGYILSLVLFYIQREYGLIGVPAGFLIDAYPIKFKLWDFVVVSLAVLFIGWLASLIPSHRASMDADLLRAK